MNYSDIFRTAFFALRGNWMRSALTSLGVIIGIAAVIVMVSIGQGTQADIDKMVSGLGSQRLDIGSAGGMGRDQCDETCSLPCSIMSLMSWVWLESSAVTPKAVFSCAMDTPCSWTDC